MTEYPGLVWLEDLRTTTSNGAHINTRWYTVPASAEEVGEWYRRHLVGYASRAEGHWQQEKSDRRVRIVHTVRISSIGTDNDAPRPRRPLPVEALTLVADETALLPL